MTKFSEFLTESTKVYLIGTKVQLKSSSELTQKQLTAYEHDERFEKFGNEVLIIKGVDYSAGSNNADNNMYKVEFEDTSKSVPEYDGVSEFYSLPGMFLKLAK